MKTKLLGLVVVVLLLSNATSVWAFGGCEQDCMKCHNLTVKEAEDLLKQIDKNIKVLSVQQAPSKGLWEVTIEAGSKKGIAYIDFAKQNLIVGQIVSIKTRENLTKKRFIELDRVDYSKIPLEGSLIWGNPDSSTKIVVFDDPECPFCARLHEELKRIVQERRDIAIYIKLFPLTKIHKDAYRKALAIQCENSIELLERSFKKQPVPDPKCKTDVIDKNIALAKELGITGTPTIVLPDGRVIRGFIKAEQLLELLKKTPKEEKTQK